MKNTIQVLNIKCGGCANTITKTLEKSGAKNIKIDIAKGDIEYEDGRERSEIISLLSRLGYPEVGTPETEAFLTKAKSYISCAIGKVS